MTDAQGIGGGGEESVLRCWRDKTESGRAAKFLPIAKQALDKVGLAKQYNTLAGQAANLGVMKGDDAKIESYVTSRAMAGLYQVIADEERAIRKDPVGTGSAILKKVFGG